MTANIHVISLLDLNNNIKQWNYISHDYIIVERGSARQNLALTIILAYFNRNRQIPARHFAFIFMQVDICNYMGRVRLSSPNL